MKESITYDHVNLYPGECVCKVRNLSARIIRFGFLDEETGENVRFRTLPAGAPVPIPAFMVNSPAVETYCKSGDLILETL